MPLGKSPIFPAHGLRPMKPSPDAATHMQACVSASVSVFARLMPTGYLNTGIRIFKALSSFLKKACESGCIGEIEDILTVWHQCVLDASGILKAKLIYVTEPDHEQLEGIQLFLCKEFHKKTVQLSMEEDQKLLGGFILKAEDVEYDYSLKAQLKQLFGA